MMIEVLVCRADGTQSLETREVPDDYYAPAAPAATAEESE